MSTSFLSHCTDCHRIKSNITGRKNSRQTPYQFPSCHRSVTKMGAKGFQWMTHISPLNLYRIRLNITERKILGKVYACRSKPSINMTHTDWSIFEYSRMQALNIFYDVCVFRLILNGSCIFPFYEMSAWALQNNTRSNYSWFCTTILIFYQVLR